MGVNTEKNLNDRIEHLNEIQQFIAELILNKEKINSICIVYEVEGADMTVTNRYLRQGNYNCIVGLVEQYKHFLHTDKQIQGGIMDGKI